METAVAERRNAPSLSWPLALSQRRLARMSALLATTSMLALPAAVAAPESYELAFTDAPPTIDGQLTDAAWSTATVLDRFVRLGGQETAEKDRAQTRALLLADRENLYIGVHCGEPHIDKLVVRHTERDSDVWRDDDVEIMIVPCARGGDRYVQLAVNPAGALMDAFLPGHNAPLERGYDSNATVKAVIGDDHWTVEMAIPLASLPIESVKGPWSFHIARARRPTGAYLTSLRTPVAGFHELTAYASLTGIERLGLPLGMRDFSFGRLLYGENICTFVVTGDKAALTSAAVEVDGKPRMLFDQAALQIMTGTLALPYSLLPEDRGKSLAIKLYAQERLLQSRMITLNDLPEKMLGRSSRSVFMFYPGNFVEFRLPLHVTGSRDSPLSLAWSASNAAGTAVGGGVTTPTGPRARIRLYWRRWRPGTYSIDCRLSREGQELARQIQTIRLEANPWEVSQ